MACPLAQHGRREGGGHWQQWKGCGHWQQWHRHWFLGWFCSGPHSCFDNDQVCIGSSTLARMLATTIWVLICPIPLMIELADELGQKSTIDLAFVLPTPFHGHALSCFWPGQLIRGQLPPFLEAGPSPVANATMLRCDWTKWTDFTNSGVALGA